MEHLYVKEVMTTENDIFIVEKVLAGQTQAFAFLVDKYKDMVFTLAIGLIRNREEAEEIAQDAFLKAFHALPKFQRKSKFSTWLYRITYNECISRLRKKKTRIVSFEDLENTESGINFIESESDWEEREEQKRELSKVLLKLNESDRTLIMLYYYDGCPVEEISSVISISQSNVKTRLFRIRNKLHAELIKASKNEIVNSEKY